jgi:hypothetical protein
MIFGRLSNFLFYLNGSSLAAALPTLTEEGNYHRGAPSCRRFAAETRWLLSPPEWIQRPSSAVILVFPRGLQKPSGNQPLREGKITALSSEIFAIALALEEGVWWIAIQPKDLREIGIPPLKWEYPQKERRVLFLLLTPVAGNSRAIWEKVRHSTWRDGA